MKERKAASKRIDHPYARYSNAGQLSCSLCHLAVKNEVLWPAHLTSKVHRQNVRQQQIAEAQAEAEAEAQLEASSRSSSAVVGGGTKRGAEDVERAGQEDEEAAGPAKRVRWEDKQHNDEMPSVDAASGSSSLPPGFFDDPSKAPTFETSQSGEGNATTAIPPAPEDDEMAEFEAFLAQEEPEASTSAAGPTVFSAQATITADEVLFNNNEDEEAKANGDQADEEEEDDEDKETEEERQAREEREELMERIEQ